MMRPNPPPSAPPASQPPSDSLRRVRRGMWIATASALVATAGAGVFVAVILLGLEYDFESGLFEPFGPVWRPVALLAFALAWPVPMFSGHRVARWGAVVGLACGAAWLLFLADLEPEWVSAALATAGCWAVAGFSLGAFPSVGAFSAFQRERGQSYAHVLGHLTTEADARRWIAAARAWNDAGVFSRRDRLRMGAALQTWLAAQSTAGEALAREIDALIPPGRARRGRLLERLRRGPLAESPERSA